MNIRPAVGLLAALLCMTAGFAGDMTLEMAGGKDIVLHEDNTWSYENSRLIDLEEDFTVELGDGRIVLIGADGNWQFVTKEFLAKKARGLGVQVIKASGKGSSKDVAFAKGEARKRAYAQAAHRLKAKVKSLKASNDKVIGCIERVEKEEYGQESFTTGKGWDAIVEVELDQGSIRAVVDCCTPEEAKKNSAAAN